jgi:hypothetical protein
MKKFTFLINFSVFLICFGFALNTNAQVNVHASDFNISQGEAFTTTGAIGTSPWTVSRSGDDWGARIHNNILEMTNTASTNTNVAGWAYSHLETNTFALPYNTTLANNTDIVSWYFNMRQIRTDPAGFSSTSYGVAFIIGSTSISTATEGNGYAVVLGNTSTPDPVRFVKFTGGLQSLGTTTPGLILAGEPLNNPTNSHMSLKLTYNPSTHVWNLYGRNDGAGFADPQAGELTLLGSVTENEYTGIAFPYMGAYWQGSTGAGQTAFFDNVSVWVDGSGAIPPTISNITTIPATDITPETTVSVSADITAGDAAISIVELRWGLIDSELLNTIGMSLSEGITYITNTDIPAQNHEDIVYFKIYAEDIDGETALSSLQSYQVIDPTITYDIVSVETIEDISVDFGTEFAALTLPSTVTVTLDNDDTEELSVVWEEGDYDGNIANTYILTGIIQLIDGITNPSNIQANINVIVLEEVVPLAIVSVEALEDITVDFGTLFAALPLPATVEVTLDDTSTEILNVTWEQGTYNGNVDGTYTLVGNIELIAGITNPENIKASISVIVSPEVIVPEEVTIVGWTFPVADNRGANLGIEDNIGKLISRETSFAGSYSYTTGTNPSIRTTSWDGGNGVKFWVVEFSTIGYENLTLSSAQRSSNTGPRDFKVQYKIEAGDWTDLENSNITVADNFTTGVLNNLSLPETLKNRSSVSLRWIMRSNTSVGGTTVASTGASNISNILIKGFAGEFPVNIISVSELAPFEVLLGTVFADLVLPESVTVTLDNLSTTSLDINWIEGEYDGSTLGTYTIFGDLVLTGEIYNPENLQAEITLFVVDEITTPNTIVSIEVLDDVIVNFGTAFADLVLPETVTVTLDNEETEILGVNWAQGSYNGNIADTYTLVGTLQLIIGIENPENLTAEVNVIVNPGFEPEVVVGWTFPVADNFGADLGIESNIGKNISRESGFEGSYTFPMGVTTQSISSTSWASGADLKYWIVEFSTIGYGDLILSSAQQSSSTGPRDFKVQYKFGQNDWTDLDGAVITTENNFTAGVLNEIALPEILNNKASVSLRWIMTSNISVGGGEVAGAGTSRIDNIIIEGMFSEDFKRIVTSVEVLDDINVEVFTTTFADLNLPETVTVFFDDEGSEELSVIWSAGDFNGDVVGEYIIEGDIILGDNMLNPDGIKASVKVIVQEPIILYTVVFNVDMSTHPDFDATSDVVYIRGDMNGWGVPGTNDPIQLMTQVGETLVYTITFELEEGTYEYKYYKNAGTSNPEGGDNRSVTITEDIVINDSWLTTGINEVLEASIVVYPNPAKNFINISSDFEILNIQIINTTGQVLLDYSEVKGSIQVNNLNNGLYFIKITTKNGIITKKIIINK